MALPHTNAGTFDERYIELQNIDGVRIKRVYQLSTQISLAPENEDPQNLRFIGMDGLEVKLKGSTRNGKIGFQSREEIDEEPQYRLVNTVKNIGLDYSISLDNRES